MQATNQRNSVRLWAGTVCVIVALALFALAQSLIRTSPRGGFAAAALGFTILAMAVWMVNQYLNPAGN